MVHFSGFARKMNHLSSFGASEASAWISNCFYYCCAASLATCFCSSISSPSL
ncbi:MAG: hypothetical protein U5L45_04515 [Saprospiraceae bacterium]|nr:hypothetical protein [Saprospiraceae bacterium]